MADPQTFNVGLAVPLRGSDPGTWDIPLNGDFTALDGFFGGIQTISAGGSSPITLTSPAGFVPTPSGGPTQAQNGILRFTGSLTGNVQITLPLPGYVIIENLTTATGSFVLSFRAIGSGEVIAVEQGTLQHIYNDGVNVRFVNLPVVGSYLDLCLSATPLWVTSCTKPPYLNCDGSTFNASTYPILNSMLGGNTLPDLRGVARYTLNQGTSRLTAAGSGLDGNTRFSIKTTQALSLGTANLPAYTPLGSVATTSIALVSGTPAVTGNNTSVAPLAGGQNVSAGTVGNIVIQSTSVFTGSPQGGSSTPFGTVGPGTVSGITLIRAA